MDEQDLSLQLGVVLDQAWAYHPANSKNKLEGPSVKYCFSCDIASSNYKSRYHFFPLITLILREETMIEDIRHMMGFFSNCRISLA